MKIINLSSIANPISISVQNPSRSDYDRFIGLEHYDSGEPVITRFQGTELLTTSAKAFKANDILIARRNVYLKRAGIVFFDGITSGDSIILRLKEDTQKTIGYSREDLIRYIPFMLNSEHFWIYANKHADGMNSKRISKDTLLEYEFELPSIDEMRDISDKLWAAYRLKEAYKKLLVTTDEMVKSQFIEMYYNTHNKQTLESVCPIMSKGITPKYVESSSVLVINQACIHWDGQRLGNIKYHNEEIPVRKRILESGDVLLNATGNGTLGRCCVFICPSDNNTYINDGHVIALSTDRAVILPEVLNTYLSLNDTQAEIYRQYVTGSTNQVDIVFSDIKKMKVPVPSMDEQILFVEVLKQADKSIIIRKPTRGQGNPLNQNDFWNLAGRAGRLGKEYSGNIFCIEPSKWSVQPEPNKTKQEIKRALNVIENKGEELLNYIRHESPRQDAEKRPDLEFAFGYFYIRYVLEEETAPLNPFYNELMTELYSIQSKITLPSSIIKKNPGISPLAQQKLYNFFTEHIDEIDTLIPVYPNDTNAFEEYKNLIDIIGRTISYYPPQLNASRAILLINWMSGKPLSYLIRKSYESYKRNHYNKKLPAVIREVMENVESFVRYQFAKDSSCYIDILRYVLEINNKQELMESIPQLNLWLEFGVSQKTHLSLLALGLSRNTVLELTKYIISTKKSKDECLEWLRSLDLDELELSPIIIDDIKKVL